MESGGQLHICDICRRPRSREFHRRYPAGQRYPRVHSICSCCRRKPRGTSCELLAPQQSRDHKSKNRFVHIMSTTVSAVKIVGQALLKRHGLNIHVHHHHWYHDDEVEGYCSGQYVEARQGIVEEKSSRSRRKDIITGEPPAEIPELPDGPSAALYELPVYRESANITPRVEEKP